jgi:hypothetical protein
MNLSERDVDISLTLNGDPSCFEWLQGQSTTTLNEKVIDIAHLY